MFLIYGPLLTIALDDFIDFSWILTLQLSLKEEKEQIEGWLGRECGKLLNKK